MKNCTYSTGLAYKFAMFATSLVIGASLFVSPARAQSTSATIGFSPASFQVGTSTPTQVNLVYTGPDINGAEIHITLDSNVRIQSMTVGSGLVELLNNATTGEIHLGKLQGTITSGTTIATVSFVATSCNSASGTVSINTSSTEIPNISGSGNLTVSPSSASYTVNCGGSGGSGGGGSTTTAPTPSSLPRTNSTSSVVIPVVVSSILVAVGFAAYKVSLGKNSSDDIQIEFE